MPNWCDNLLRVAGEKNEVNKFLKDGIKDDKWRLSAYLPTPEELLDNEDRSEKNLARLRKKYGFDHWYEWRLANYGCKWDCDAGMECINWVDGVLAITFESPWSPPVEFLEHIQKMYPELDFTLLYMELGCFFAGLAQTVRDEDGKPSIENFCGEPYYTDENGDVVNTGADDFDWEKFEENHELIACNPFEEEVFG